MVASTHGPKEHRDLVNDRKVRHPLDMALEKFRKVQDVNRNGLNIKEVQDVNRNGLNIKEKGSLSQLELWSCPITM